MSERETITHLGRRTPVISRQGICQSSLKPKPLMAKDKTSGRPHRSRVQGVHRWVLMFVSEQSGEPGQIPVIHCLRLFKVIYTGSWMLS